MLGRPAPLWILAVLGTIGGLLCTLVVLQFAEVVPWAGGEGSFIGGQWTGVVMYAAAAGFYFGAAFAWLTVKPWAHMVSILAAIIGFAIPFMSHMDGTEPLSSAVAPIVVSVLMLFMVFRPSTNRAMALALSGQGSVKTGKTPPPPKPLSAARKRELAEEQKKAKAAPMPTNPQPVAAQPASMASTMATSAASAASAASATMANVVSNLPKTASGTIPKAATAAPVRPAFAGMAKSAAAMLGKSSPGQSAKPVTAQYVPLAPTAVPTSGLPANQSRPRGFRADEV